MTVYDRLSEPWPVMKGREYDEKTAESARAKDAMAKQKEEV